MAAASPPPSSSSSSSPSSYDGRSFCAPCYQYRLAPADAPLTEETFMKLPLVSCCKALSFCCASTVFLAKTAPFPAVPLSQDFVGNSSLRWGGKGGEQIWFKGGDVGGPVRSHDAPPSDSYWRSLCQLKRAAAN
eukprot:SAG22_NODE_180_length_16069_cov_5.323231_7_plen_134_part_00